MGKLKIDGLGTVDVDDSFANLSSDQQHAFVADVTAKIRAGARSGGGEPLPAPANDTGRLGMSADPSDPGSIAALTTGGIGPDGRLNNELSLSGLAKGADAVVGAIARGIPFQDRIAAAGAAATGLGGRFGDYAGNLAAARALDQKQAADNPQGELPGKLTGGLLSAMALPSAAGGVIEKASGTGIPATLLARMLAFGKDGALLGGLTGASDAPDLTNVPDVAGRAGRGTVEGAIAGAALPPLGTGLGYLASKVSPFISKPIDGVGRVASGLLANFMTPGAAETVAKLGPNASLLDASPSLLGLGQGVAAEPSAAADKIVDFVNARHAGQSDRLVSDLNTHFGPAFSPTEVAGMMDAKRTALSPLLEQADAHGVMWNPELAELSQRPAVAKALRSASDTAANEGRPLPMVSLDETGQQVSPATRIQYETYAQNARQRLTDATSELLGSGGGLATADELIAQRKALADPLYAQFRASDIPMTDRLRDLMQRPSVRSALPGAERLAQDEGKSIYVGGRMPDDPTHEPIPTGDMPPVPPVESYQDRITAVRPDAPRPQSLQDFIKSAGGIQDRGGDLKAMGFDSVRGMIAKPGQGLSADAMRQAAAQAGYLGADIDHAMASTTPNDLFDALERHPVHSVYDADAAHAWNNYDQVRAEADTVGRGGSSAGPRRGTPLGLLDPGSEDPAAAPVRKITPEGWDYVKRALDDKIGGAKRTGANNEARVWTGLKGELTSALDDASPIYRQARQTFAGHSDLIDALQGGQDAIRRNATSEELRRGFGALGTDGERAMYRLGAAHGLREMVAAAPDGSNLARPLVGDQRVRDKIAALAPSPGALDRFNGQVADTGRTFEDAQRPDVRGWRYALENLRQQEAKATGDQRNATSGAAALLAAQLHTLPAFARADLGRQSADKAEQAFDLGRKVLRSGDAAPWPADMQAAISRLPLEQQAMLRAGARSDIEQRFGQNRNDLSALHRIVGGENDFNRDNMGTLFGPGATRNMVEAATREQAFANTRNAIAAGSRTAPMTAGKAAIDEAVKAPERPTFGKDTTVTGLLLNLAEAATRKVGSAAAAAAGQKARDDIARVLIQTGDARDAMQAELAAKAAARARSVAPLQAILGSPYLVPALVSARNAGR